jgi:hypothetical protein
MMHKTSIDYDLFINKSEVNDYRAVRRMCRQSVFPNKLKPNAVYKSRSKRTMCCERWCLADGEVYGVCMVYITILILHDTMVTPQGQPHHTPS